MFDWLFGYEAKRQRLLKKVPSGALHEFLSVPFHDKNTPFDELPILAVDFETTGLNAKTDKLLSVGFVELNQQQIPLKTCYHEIIKISGKLDHDNVTIHQITDSQKEDGKALKEVVEALLKALAGKVMLVHFARIEKQFLTQACIELYGVSPVFPIIDTLALAKKRLDNRDVAYDPSELRLSSLRHHYGLPEHFAHNALNDAIATAELLMAQVNHLPTKEKTKLSDIIL